jgi:1-aminocyclopropane-1-carboxylate deaminase
MSLNFTTPDVSYEEVDLRPFIATSATLVLAREDRIHPFVSGNKFRKLKYNLLEAKKMGKDTLLTFGGAFSNHIAAVAAAGESEQFRTIGIIRGEELAGAPASNPTLQFALSRGMELHFISREQYRQKMVPQFLQQLYHRYGAVYLLPEGGTNFLAVQGCAEIVNNPFARDAHYLCAPVGTGGTLAGLVAGSRLDQKVLGFSVLKGTFQQSLVAELGAKKKFSITDAYHFGGYAKIDTQLVRFINTFRRHTGIPLDPVYTGKMMYGIIDLLKRGHFTENSRIFAVHTGGLQGISGMNLYLKKKHLPQIE